jgi:hypothetical protein
VHCCGSTEPIPGISLSSPQLPCPTVSSDLTTPRSCPCVLHPSTRGSTPVSSASTPAVYRQSPSPPSVGPNLKAGRRICSPPQRPPQQLPVSGDAASRSSTTLGGKRRSPPQIRRSIALAPPPLRQTGCNGSRATFLSHPLAWIRRVSLWIPATARRYLLPPRALIR